MKRKLLISIMIVMISFFVFNGRFFAKGSCNFPKPGQNEVGFEFKWSCTGGAYLEKIKFGTFCKLHSTCEKEDTECQKKSYSTGGNGYSGTIRKSYDDILRICKLSKEDIFANGSNGSSKITAGIDNGNDIEYWIQIRKEDLYTTKPSTTSGRPNPKASSTTTTTGEYKAATTNKTSATITNIYGEVIGDENGGSGDQVTRNTKAETNIGLTTYDKNDPNANINAICAKLRTHDDKSESFMDLFEKYWNIVLIFTPILMILFISIEYLKAVTSNDQDLIQKATNNTIKRLIACLLIFALPTIIRIIFSLFGLSACL